VGSSHFPISSSLFFIFDIGINDIGVFNMSYKKWTDEEIQFLKDNQYKSIKELSLLLNRSKSAIDLKGRKLGLKFYTESLILNHEELEKFKILYPQLKRKQLKDIFSNLSYNQIQELAFRLNLKKNHKLKYCKCTCCGVEYEYTDQNFLTKLNHKKCRNCRNLEQNITEYYNKYGIILDSKKYFFTYSIIQWYDFLFKTPNGKKIKFIPRELLNNENLAILFKHVLNLNNINTRSQILKLNKKFLYENKICYKINKQEISIYDYINITFPEMNIKLWEMVRTPNNYFDKEDNIIDALKWVVINRNISEDNVLGGALTSTLFRKLGLRMLVEKFNTMDDIIIFYYHKILNKNIKIEDIYKSRKLLSKDGTTICNSTEEVLVFDFIKYTMNLNIKCISTQKTKSFYNEKYNEYYYPDFSLEYLNRIIIIEYFGMYEKNPKTKLYIEYKNKTFRKIEYYKSRKDIYFIDLYPQDIRWDYKGVKNKLASFFMFNFNNNIK